MRVVCPTRDADIAPEIGVRAFLKRIYREFGISVVSSPEDLIAGVLREMFSPYLGARRIRRIGELKRYSTACLNAGKRRAHYPERVQPPDRGKIGSRGAPALPCGYDHDPLRRRVGTIITSWHAPYPQTFVRRCQTCPQQIAHVGCEIAPD